MARTHIRHNDDWVVVGVDELTELEDTPSGYGTDGQVLTTDGTDTLTWEDIPDVGAGSVEELLNDVTDTTSRTINLRVWAQDDTTNNNTFDLGRILLPADDNKVLWLNASYTAGGLDNKYLSQAFLCSQIRSLPEHDGTGTSVANAIPFYVSRDSVTVLTAVGHSPVYIARGRSSSNNDILRFGFASNNATNSLTNFQARIILLESGLTEGGAGLDDDDVNALIEAGVQDFAETGDTSDFPDSRISTNIARTSDVPSGAQILPTGGTDGQIPELDITGGTRSILWVDAPEGTTNLDVGTRTATTLEVTSSTGDNVTLPSASDTEAGVMPSADKEKLDDVPTVPTAEGVYELNVPSGDGALTWVEAVDTMPTYGDDSDVEAVGTANDAGDNNDLARIDHVHRGNLPDLAGELNDSQIPSTITRDTEIDRTLVEGLNFSGLTLELTGVRYDGSDYGAHLDLLREFKGRNPTETPSTYDHGDYVLIGIELYMCTSEHSVTFSTNPSTAIPSHDDFVRISVRISEDTPEPIGTEAAGDSDEASPANHVHEASFVNLEDTPSALGSNGEILTIESGAIEWAAPADGGEDGVMVSSDRP